MLIIAQDHQKAHFRLRLSAIIIGAKVQQKVENRTLPYANLSEFKE